MPGDDAHDGLEDQPGARWDSGRCPPGSEVADDDPLFSAPSVSADEPIDEVDIDDVLYGEIAVPNDNDRN
ncbi:hypothetical protein B1756_16925 [Natrarchaeobaculum aegyptiacum]|uniref:Uncharacterized protein n=1 Tax=Natrarchaeobaculum aegyptiacum TaxID=745377 RepID=A0A2Z2HWK6_9EURY|nr:hypothetical protein B1756_16925 [Natrarchaeobaculum aegyptiacum]